VAGGLRRYLDNRSANQRPATRQFSQKNHAKFFRSEISPTQVIGGDLQNG
jgi:hypothetical protein